MALSQEGAGGGTEEENRANASLRRKDRSGQSDTENQGHSSKGS